MGRLRPDGDLELSAALKAGLFAVFALSGAVSLVYEVAWARLLAVHLGSTSQGHTLVIATFMGGLGLGYLWLGRRADRSPNPLRLYAFLEAGVTLWALAFPWLLDTLAARFGGGLGLAIAVVALPTVLMGGTLPALVSALARREAPGETIATLYGVNALGAAFGVFFAGFWLIEAVGVRWAGWSAACVNGALALIAWALSRRSRGGRELHDRSLAPGRLVLWACIAAGVVGLVSMALQGAWIRLFGVVLGSSSYSFSLVIGTYIAGMALGSVCVRRWAHRLPAMTSLSLIATAAAFVLWLSAPGFSALPFELAGLREELLTRGASFEHYTLVRLGLIASLILLPTLAFGAALPLSAQIAAVGQPGAGTGQVFGANTLGAVLGAATSVPLLIGWWGLDGVHQAGIVALALLGVVLSVAVDGRGRWMLAALAIVTALLPLWRPVSWDPREVSAGAFRMSERKAETPEDFRARLHRSELLFHADGPDATVAVLERGAERVLMVNGKPDASTRGDMVTQVMSAHVPLLLHPAPTRALVVGLGSGVTVGSALRHPNIEVMAIEVSQAVVQGSRLFDEVSGAPLEDARVTLVTDDVRSALRERPEARFDVIISEPSNPWVAGNAGLFSVDYFERLAARLNPGGVTAQWVQRYETDDATLTMVIRSFSEAFEVVEIWQLYPTDLLLIGHQGDLRSELSALPERLAPDAVAKDLKRVGVPGLHGLMSLQAMTPKGVQALLATPGPLNTDDHPLLEFEGPRRLYARAKAGLIKRHDVRAGRSDSEGWRFGALSPPAIETLEALFAFHTTYPGAPEDFRLRWVPRFLAESEPSFLIDLLFTLVTEGRWALSEPLAERLLERAPEDPRALHVVAHAWHAHALERGGEGDRLRLLALLERCVALGDEPRRRCARLTQKVRGK